MLPPSRTLLAALPVAVVFALIGSQRVRAWKAALLGALLAIALAVLAFQLPWPAALAAAAYGVATGLFPILYIIWGSLLLYNLTVTSGWAERLRSSLAHLASDRHFLLLLVGFGFAAFLDSTAGFLTPVTVATALLVGLGVPAMEAAAYTLVASSLPPIFGAMSIPVLVLSDVAHVPLASLARAQAAVAAVLFAGFPLWLTATFGGAGAVRRLWVSAVVAGVAYSTVLWWMVTRVSLYPAALAASIAALAAIVGTGTVRRAGAAQDSASAERRDGGRGVERRPRSRWASLLPWWPYWVLMACVVAWSLPAVAAALNRFTWRVNVPHLAGLTWRIDLLASPGTAILLGTVLVALIGCVGRDQIASAVRLSNRQIAYPLVNMLAMFALAQVMNASGMTRTLGVAVAGTGHAFPLLSPFLSWLGAAIAGSNTASNALLGRLQSLTAVHLGLEPTLALAFAGAAAPLGKMVAPQVISAAAAAGSLGAAEGRLLRIGLFHSLVWTSLVGIAGLASSLLR